ELHVVRARRHLNRALDDDDPRVLLDLVLAECLPGLDRDEHRPRALVLVHDVRIACTARSFDRAKVPVLHGRDLDTELDSAPMSLAVDRFVLDNVFAANCWVVRPATDAPAAVIDPGGDPEPLLAAGIDVAG